MKLLQANLVEPHLCAARETWRSDVAGTIALEEGERCRLIRYNPERWSLVASLERNRDFVGWFPSELLLFNRDSLPSVADEASRRSSALSTASLFLNDAMMKERILLAEAEERKHGMRGSANDPSADRLLLRKAQLHHQEQVLEEFWRMKL